MFYLSLLLDYVLFVAEIIVIESLVYNNKLFRREDFLGAYFNQKS